MPDKAYAEGVHSIVSVPCYVTVSILTVAHAPVHTLVYVI